MSEFPNARPDLEDVRWSDVGGTKTDPTALKDNGYPLDATPGSEDRNFQLNALFRWLQHVDGRTPREFDSLRTALNATTGVTPPESFRIRQADPVSAKLRARGEILFDLQGAAGAVPVDAMATDGELLYYSQGAEVFAVDPDTGDNGAGGGFGTFIWNITAPRTVTALSADGAFLYLGMITAVGLDDVQSRNRLTGALVSGLQILSSAANKIVTLESNGDKLVVVTDFASLNISVVDIDVSGNLTIDGQDTFADQNALAIDDEFAWTGGTRAVDDVHKIRLSTFTEVLGITLPTVSAPTVRAICTDGSYVYVFVDQIEVTSHDGATARVFCLERLTGVVVWFSNFPGGNPVSCTVDQSWLYAGDNNDDTFVLDKANGRALWFIPNTVVKAADGASVFGVDVAPFHDIRKHSNGDATVNFQAVLGTDINRRPFFNSAVPRVEVVSAEELLPPPIFGREKDRDENLSSTSTASETFVEHQTWATDVLQGGTYRIEWYYVWRYDNNTSSNSFEAQVDLDSGTIIHSHVQQPQSTNASQRHIVSGLKDIVLSAAAHQIDIDLQRVGGAGTVTIEESRLSIYRVA